MRIFAFLLTLLFALPVFAQDDTFSCLDEFGGPLTTFTGDQPLANYDFFDMADEERFDARNATFYSQTVDQIDYTVNADPFVNYPVDIRSNGVNQGCWAGGAHVSNNPLDITQHESKGGTELPNRNSAALMGKDVAMIFDGVRVHNQHDSFRPYFSDTPDPNISWEIRNSWTSYNRDDCIEADWASTGLVEDSLFDGCFVFFSATWGDTPQATFTIQNSLVYLEKLPGPWGWDDNQYSGHGELFKTRGTGPRFALHNNVFLIDDYATTRWDVDGNAENSFAALGFHNLDACSGNIIVWIPPASDPGAPFPGNVPSDPACVTITTDTTVWDNAKAAWINAHPEVTRISGVDDEWTAPAMEVTGLELREDPSGTLIDGDVINGETVDITAYSDTTTMWQAIFTGPVESIKFEDDGVTEVIENGEPYNDTLANYEEGWNTITLTPYDQDGATGNAGTPLTVLVNIIKTTPTNAAPTASFTYSCTDLNCQFNDASTDTDGNVVSWSWNFGDGVGTSTEQNPSYVFPSGDTYSVSLTVTDDDTDTDLNSQNVTVTDPVPPPSISKIQLRDDSSGLIIDDDVITGESYFLTSEFFAFEAVASGTTESVTFVTNGRQTVIENGYPYTEAMSNLDDGENILVVTPYTADNAQGTSGSSYSVTINIDMNPDSGDELVPALSSFSFFCRKLECYFVGASDDPDVDINRWSWDFGDGKTSKVESPKHTFSSPGTYTVSLTTDDTHNDFIVPSTAQRIVVILAESLTDVTDPVSTLTSPTDGTVYSVGDSISISATLTDDVGVARAEMFVEKVKGIDRNGNPIIPKVRTTDVVYQSSVTSGTYTQTFIPPRAGDYYIIVIATDVAGNSARSSPVVVTVQ